MSGFLGRVRGIPSWQITLGVALLALGFLIAIQLRSEGPRIRYSSSERPPLLETANGLLAAQEQLKARIVELRGQVGDAEASAAGNDELVQRLNDLLREARLVSGLVEVQGPGLVVRLDDSTQPVPPDAATADFLVSANDLRDVVTELWLAGAEAISVNGERIVASTALTDIGSSILVNSSYLQPPYDLSIIGPPELYDRLTTSPGFVEFTRIRVQGYGLQLGFVPAGDVVVAAYSGVINLVRTRPLPSPSAAGSSAP